MGKVYGVGAAIVILGALWKILHLPGASAMLIAGLGTEAVIFFLSAFEPPHKMPDWSLVYPELVGLESPEKPSHGGSHSNSGFGGGSELAALVQAGSLDEKTVGELVDGVKKLAQTSSQMANLSEASIATQAYLNQMKAAGDNVHKLSTLQAGTFDAIQQSGSQLADSYARLGQSVQGQVENLNQSNQTMSKQMNQVNQNLTAINSAYELQLSGITAQVQATTTLSGNLSQINEQMAASTQGAKVYREQLTQLSHTVSELNSIYGNMLSAMNVNR